MTHRLPSLLAALAIAAVVCAADVSARLVAQDLTGANVPRAAARADSDADRFAVSLVDGTFARAIVGRADLDVVDTDGDDASRELRALRLTAARLEDDGQLEAAASLLERALAQAEAMRGPRDLQTASAAVQLAAMYRTLADGVRAEPLYERAIAILERAVGPRHPATAFVRAQLAALYASEGDRVRAEALLRPSLEILESTLGERHPWFLSGLVTLGDLRNSAGDLDDEERIVMRALRIAEAMSATATPQYARLLNNLGEVFRQRQDYARADELLQRALALGERLLGPDHYSIATALQNLGIVARERKDYAAALAYNQRALAIRERVVGPDHPDVAHALTNLANIYRAQGNFTASLETHFRALRIWEHAAGPYQPATLLSVGNIAKAYAAVGDMPNAIAFQRRSDAILEKELALNLAVGSERQKLLFVDGARERTDRTLSLHLRNAPWSADAGALAAQALLQRKGRVLDAMIDTVAAVRQRVADVRDRDLLDQLSRLTTELAGLALNTATSARSAERERALAELEARKERLEAELSEHSAELRARLRPVTLAAVQAALPVDAALVEFAIYRPFDPRAERNAEAYAAPHYAAYVIRRDGTPHGVDLGAAAAIDGAIDGFRQALRDPARRDLRERGRIVDALVMQPVRAALDDATRLLVSPDGELNLVPFDALVDEQDRYLIERYAISYLTSGRDLLRMQVAHASASPPVIVADPLFGEPSPVARAERPIRRVSVANRGIATEDPGAVYFAPLAATADEGRAIKALFPDATLLMGRRASKSAVQQVYAPRMLHIASHGFFLGAGGDAAAAPGRAPAADAAAGNPLLRSGLALAGANLPRDARDGILTALEASALNLWGTQLVTLSACDTGVGEVRNGEGVYGLRRAFVLAGAETVVMTLWPVSDYIARETMVAYYTGLRGGLGRADALREAKLAILRRRGRQHPYYWASFIQSGEWGALDGAR